jgi:hypothetical protein
MVETQCEMVGLRENNFEMKKIAGGLVIEWCGAVRHISEGFEMGLVGWIEDLKDLEAHMLLQR